MVGLYNVTSSVVEVVVIIVIAIIIVVVVVVVLVVFIMSDRCSRGVAVAVVEKALVAA